MNIIIIALTISLSLGATAKTRECSQVFQIPDIKEIQRLYDLLKNEQLPHLASTAVHEKFEMELLAYKAHTGKSIESIFAILDSRLKFESKKEVEEKRNALEKRELKKFDPLAVVEEFHIPLSSRYVDYKLSGDKVFIEEIERAPFTYKYVSSKVIVYDLVSRKVITELATDQHEYGHGFDNNRFYRSAIQNKQSVVYDLKNKNEVVFKEELFDGHERDRSDVFLTFRTRIDPNTSLQKKLIFRPSSGKRLLHSGEHRLTKDHFIVARPKDILADGTTITLYDKEFNELNTFSIPTQFADGFVLSKKNQVVIIDEKGTFYTFDTITGKSVINSKTVVGNVRYEIDISADENHVLLKSSKNGDTIYYYGSQSKSLISSHHKRYALIDEQDPIPLDDHAVYYRRHKDSLLTFVAHRSGFGTAAQKDNWHLYDMESQVEIKSFYETSQYISADGVYGVRYNPDKHALSIRIFGLRE